MKHYRKINTLTNAAELLSIIRSFKHYELFVKYFFTYLMQIKHYFFMLFTGIRIDDPGRRTLSLTKSNGKRRGIVMDDAIFRFSGKC